LGRENNSWTENQSLDRGRNVISGAYPFLVWICCFHMLGEYFTFAWCKLWVQIDT